MKLSKIIQWIVGLGSIALLLWFVGPSTVLEFFTKVDLFWVNISLLLGVFLFFFGAFRLSLLFYSLNYTLSFRQILVAYCKSWVLGLLGLGKVGELSVIYFLKGEKKSVGEITAVTIVDKAMIFFTLLFVSIFSTAILLNGYWALLVASLTIILPILFFLALRSQKLRSWINSVILKKSPMTFAHFSTSLQSLLHNHRGAVVINAFLALIKWMIHAIVIFVIFKALGITLPIVPIFFIEVLATLIGSLPISVNGLGTREAVYLLFFSTFSLTGALIITFSLLQRVINAVLGIVTLLVILLFERKLW